MSELRVQGGGNLVRGPKDLLVLIRAAATRVELDAIAAQIPRRTSDAYRGAP